MKITSKILGFVLCCTAVLCSVALVGCKKVTLSNLEQSYQQLEDEFKANETVFISHDFEGQATDVYVSYNEKINKLTVTDKDFGELVWLYNFALSAAHNYIFSNRSFVLSLKEAELSKSAQKIIGTLNQSLVEFKNYIPSFVRERQSFLNHFDAFDNLDVNADRAALLRYKKVYGRFVDKAVNACNNVATMVEESKIFDVLQNTTPTRVDAETIKNYFGAKLLPVFCEFKINEFANKMNWSVQAEGTAKARINTLIDNVEQKFATYRDVFVSRTTSITLSQQQIKDLFTLYNKFCTEKQDYFTALKNFNFARLALDFDNNLENYLGANAYAKTYLQKVEQFVELMLPNFMEAVENVLYAA